MMSKAQKIFFILTAIPTFGLISVYIIVILLALLIPLRFELPEAYSRSEISSFESNFFTVFVLMWVFYFVWIICTRHLNRKEKIICFLGMAFLNIIAMPWFWVHMFRRINGRKNQLSSSRMKQFKEYLCGYGLEPSDLNEEQSGIVTDDLKRRRFQKWGLGMTLFFLPWLIYVT